MIPFSKLRKVSRGVWFAVVAGLISPSVIAAELGDWVEKSEAAMKAEKWQESLDWVSHVLTLPDAERKSYGPQLGVIYYRKGLCEIKLKRWAAAMESFEICYRDYPNDNRGMEGNIYQKMALLKWGEAAIGAEEWELAIGRFQKFSEERDRVRDQFPQGSFYINMAVAFYKLGKLSEGSENLEIAIRNKELFPTPEPAIIAGFQALVSSAVVKMDEQFLLDFIEKNRAQLIWKPYSMHQYSRVFMTLAGHSIEAGMERAALALYDFVPSSEATVDDLKERIKDAGPDANAMYKHELESLVAARAEGTTYDSIRLAGIALILEKQGDLKGAFSIYEELELNEVGSKNRENNLYNLIRIASLIPMPKEARDYAAMFISAYPGSSRIPELRSLLDPSGGKEAKELQKAGN
jgi:tetratricopeptide (TPR) repeat protein